mmetsp:Transcript_7993/g.14605  ORF Transcript_7993/g.14605 Transcript_7993/m.14605 type:complete len:593 (-) Transcript_7993:127-1905(-)
MDADGFEIDPPPADGINEGPTEGLNDVMNEGVIDSTMNDGLTAGIQDTIDDAGDAAFDNYEGEAPAFDEGGFGGFGDNTALQSDDTQLWAPMDKGVKDESAFSNAPTSAPVTAGGLSFDPLMGTGTSQDIDVWSKNDWPKSIGVKPDTQQQWEAKTSSNLQNAKALIRQAQHHHQDNEKHIHQSHHRHKSQSGTVHNTIKKKIGMTNDLIKALEDRLESVEDTIRQVGECLFQLQRAHRSKWAPLNVCERRLELREQRPIQELVRDHTQEALEHERQTLIEARQELTDQANACKETLVALDKLKHDVITDLGHKRHSQRIDHSCLHPVNRPHMSTHQDRVVLPQLQEVASYQLPPSPKDTDRGTGHHHEESRQVDTKSLITRAVRMEEDAMRLCNESDAVMLHTKRECTRAAQQAQQSLAKRADETDDLKKKLEAHIRELDEALGQTKTSLNQTKKKLEFHEVPLKALDKQFHLRNQRTSREGIRDHVHEELEGHLETTKKNVKILTTKFQHTKNLYEQMHASRAQLDEDYRCKLAALKIDDMCLKVTPRKAIELDRMDPRGGRCKLPVSARKAKALSFSPVSFQEQFSATC